MIDFLDTRIGEVLKKTSLLYDSIAWVELFTYDLKKEILLSWIQNDQLIKQGIDSEGNVIGHYSEATEIISGGLKKAGDRYTLKDTGDFFSSMFITVFFDYIEIDADFDKMINQEWYREQIIGLSYENIQRLVQKAKYNYPTYVRRVLGIN